MKKLNSVLIIIILLVIAGLVWWSNGSSAVDKSSQTSQIFVIQKGEGVREIASNLKAKDLIKDPVVFFLLVKKDRLDGKIQAGDFRLSKNMDLNTIAQNLTHGTLDIWITIPEGQRADEIAETLKEKVPSYNESWRPVLEQNEGYLFPDTYLIPRDATVDTIVSTMRNNFEKKYAQIASSAQLSKKDTVIIASLVEREAKFDADRPLVASVIMNRLNLGMGLQIDATIQYALGYQKGEHTWWKKELNADDLNINSPYNTKLNTGLPPTPISNPGLSALAAAASPAKTNYLYYLSDKYGHNHYEVTYDQHQADIQKYGL